MKNSFTNIHAQCSPHDSMIVISGYDLPVNPNTVQVVWDMIAGVYLQMTEYPGHQIQQIGVSEYEYPLWVWCHKARYLKPGFFGGKYPFVTCYDGPDNGAPHDDAMMLHGAD
jgi:hypothetical protein